MKESRANLHLANLIRKYPELCDSVNSAFLRSGPKEVNKANIEGRDLHLVFKKLKKLDVNKKILFAHFSPFKYELEGLGLPLYAATVLDGCDIHLTYDKGGPESKKFKVMTDRLEKISCLYDKYDVIIARSSVLSNMMRREKDACIVKDSDYKVNIKTMSYKPNYVHADHYFEEEELCPVAQPAMSEKAEKFLKKYNKRNIILITGSLWYVKTQLSFFQQVNPDLVKNFDIVVVGPEKDSSYVSSIESTCSKRGISPFIIGNVCEDFLVNLYSLSKIHVITMDMRVFGQPKGCPRMLGEGISAKVLPVCNKPVTIPSFWKESCLVYDYEKTDSLNKILKEAISIVSDDLFPESYCWSDFSFEDQCDEILEKCLQL